AERIGHQGRRELCVAGPGSRSKRSRYWSTTRPLPSPCTRRPGSARPGTPTGVVSGPAEAPDRRTCETPSWAPAGWCERGRCAEGASPPMKRRPSKTQQRRLLAGRAEPAERLISPNTVLKWSRTLQAAFQRVNRSAGKKCVRGVVAEAKLITENPWAQFTWI